MRPRTPAAAALVLSLTAGAATAQEPVNTFHEGSALPWSDASGGLRIASLFGNPRGEGEAFTYRLELPAGFEMRPHTHPVHEHMTVLSGTFFIGVGAELRKEDGMAYGPGSYVVIVAGEPAYMWTEGPAVVQVHGTGPLTTTFVTTPEVGKR